MKDHVINVLAKTATYTGSGGSMAFGLSDSEWKAIGVMVGIVIGLAGLSIQYLTYKRGRK